MATVTPYNDLTGNKTTGGTWTKISGSGPAAPGTYNGTLNFTGAADGESVYEYEVTSGGCTHTSQIIYSSITPKPRTNDDCTGAMPLVESRITLYNDERCPGLVAPTDSGVAAPSAWGSTPADLWFKLFIPTSASTVSVEIVIDGSPYNDGVSQPMLAIYSGTCGALVEEDSSISFNSVVSVSFTVSGSLTPTTRYARMASPVGYEGQFDVIVNIL